MLFSIVRGARPGKNVQLSEGEIRGLCLKSREIFLSQPILLELEAPLKICGECLFWFTIYQQGSRVTALYSYIYMIVLYLYTMRVYILYTYHIHCSIILYIFWGIEKYSISNFVFTNTFNVTLSFNMDLFTISYYSVIPASIYCLHTNYDYLFTHFSMFGINNISHNFQEI